MPKAVGYKKIFGFVLPDFVDDKTVKIIVYGFVTLMVFLFAMIFFVWPSMKGVETLKTNLKQEEANLATLKSSKKGLDDMDKTLSGTDKQLLFSAMPVDYSPDITVFLIRGMCNETNVSLMSYTLPEGVLSESDSDKAAKSGFNEHKIQVVISGSIENILRFISRVESALPFGVVSDLNVQELSKLSKLSQTGTLQTTVEVIFYQPYLGKINLSDLKEITNSDLESLKQIKTYKPATGIIVGLQSDVASDSTVSSGVNNNLFGL